MKRVKWTSKMEAQSPPEATLESLPDELIMKIIKMAAASDRKVQNKEEEFVFRTGTDSVIPGDFGAMSAAEQESHRAQWKEELTRTEEDIATLRQVLLAKEATAAGLKKRLGELISVTNSLMSRKYH